MRGGGGLAPAYEGDRLVEIVEFDAEDHAVARTYNQPEPPDSEDDQRGVVDVG